MKSGRKTNDQEMEWRKKYDKEAKKIKGSKINQREKLNHDKVICGREGDRTEMSRKSFQWKSKLQ